MGGIGWVFGWDEVNVAVGWVIIWSWELVVVGVWLLSGCGVYICLVCCGTWWFAWMWVTLRSVWASAWVVLSPWYERLEWVGCLGYNNCIGLL